MEVQLKAWHVAERAAREAEQVALSIPAREAHRPETAQAKADAQLLRERADQLLQQLLIEDARLRRQRMERLP